MKLYEDFPSGRSNSFAALDREQPWPLPECRLNEWVALIDLSRTRQETVPIGDSFPFGAISLDIGTQWFRELALKGHRFKDFSFGELAVHGWADESGAGHPALFDFALYEKGEAIARSVLIAEYGLDAAVLDQVKGSRWYSRFRTFIRSRIGR